jgi:hypothetical protein
LRGQELILDNSAGKLAQFDLQKPVKNFLKTLFLNVFLNNAHLPNRLPKYPLPSLGWPFKRGAHIHISGGDNRRKLTCGWQLEGRCACAGLVVFRLHAEIIDPSMFPEK